MSEQCNCEDELVYDDGRAICPVEDCDWWVPMGMEYLYHEHWVNHE